MQCFFLPMTTLTCFPFRKSIPSVGKPTCLHPLSTYGCAHTCNVWTGKKRIHCNSQHMLHTWLRETNQIMSLFTKVSSKTKPTIPRQFFFGKMFLFLMLFSLWKHSYVQLFFVRKRRLTGWWWCFLILLEAIREGWRRSVTV